MSLGSLLSPLLMRCWSQRSGLAISLLPLAGLFRVGVEARRLAYRKGWLKSVRLPVPVVVVGNVTVGGAGKTPLTLHLAQRLRALGKRPGIVSRGYGGQRKVQAVGAESQPAQVGDEPLLLHRRSACPVYVGRDRVAAARALLAAHPETDLILCDDGLQHYRLARDLEIAVIDGRGLMNGWLLPAGPLREPPSRLRQVDARVAHGWSGEAEFRMRLEGELFYRLDDATQWARAETFRGERLHAVAGIGDPARFFAHLATLGLHVIPHPFADHHVYVAEELAFGDGLILTTEKDAVKLAALLAAGQLRLPVWVLPVTAEVTPDLARFILEKIDGRPPA